MGRFLLPLLEAHDLIGRHFGNLLLRRSGPRIRDAMTDRCRAPTPTSGETCSDLSDEQLADMAIRQDRIDILVDLTMHMGNNRLLVFARKPAPVQVTYLAYAGTTGLSTMDYRLTDPYLDPPGQDKPIYSEQSIRLPESYWCYRPLGGDSAGELLCQPIAAAGHITFGCLEQLLQSGTCRRLWPGALYYGRRPDLNCCCTPAPAATATGCASFFTEQRVSPELD